MSTVLVVIAFNQEGVVHSQTPPSPYEIEAAIRATWPDHLAERAIRRAHCESTMGLDPRTWDMWRVHVGPFQFATSIWKPYFETMGYSWYDMVFDPYLNAWGAYHIYQRQGAGAWPNC